MEIAVSSRNQVRKHAKRFEATHILSLIERGRVIYRPRSVVRERHLTVYCDDVVNPDMPQAPTREHVEQILAFGRRLPEDARLLVHCEAGVSRSTAAAFLILTQHIGGAGGAGEKHNVEQAAARLLAARPQARPNPLILKYGAEILGCPSLVQAGEKISAMAWSRNADTGISR